MSKPISSLRAAALFSGLVFLCGLAAPATAQLVEASGYFLDLGVENQPFGRLAVSLAQGDFNGDGFDDLAAGAPDFNVDGVVNAGAVFIAFGGPQGLSSANLQRLTASDSVPASDCAMPAPRAEFGRSLAVADFNGDGLDDLAIGVPFGSATTEEGVFLDVGGVAVFWGRADSTFQPAKCFINARGGLPGGFEQNSAFGFALAAGDFESDGVPDLAIGAPGATVDQTSEGAVTVIYGSLAEPLDPAVSQYWHQNVEGIPGSAETSDQFGASLASGDLVLGMETACDLVIGVPDDHLESAGLRRGSVHVLFGCTANGLSAEDTVRWTAEECLLDGAQDFAQFGRSLAVGNFDLQGSDDLAIGAPGDPFGGALTDVGSVCMLYGDQRDPASVQRQSLRKLEITVAAEGDRFGEALAAVELDDRSHGLAVGAPTDGPPGQVPSFLFYEAQEGSLLSSDRGFHYEYVDVDPDHSLGSSLVAAKFDGTVVSVAAGAPFLNLPDADEAGAIWVLPVARIFADGFESGDLSAWAQFSGGK